eukprot:15308440-Alexandrium_andersonii.AAC.1
MQCPERATRYNVMYFTVAATGLSISRVAVARGVILKNCTPHQMHIYRDTAIDHIAWHCTAAHS